MAPEPLLVTSAALLGLLVGSFLNVVVHRVPRGQSVAFPPSACPVCDHRVRARDNVPVLSWLLLRGRCRDCRARISARYPLVEAGTAVAFAVVTAVVGLDWSLPAWLYLTAISVALALIDLDVHRLPDAIVLPSYPVSAVLLTVAALADHRPSALLGALLGAVVLGGIYLALHLARPDGMGLGDVKLAGLLGLHLGWLGWGELAVGGFLAFLLGGLVALPMVLAGRAGRSTALPFGPFMLAGAFAALLAGDALVGAYLDLAGL
ncbi:leader peptidase (prepilin peptidase) / N-methyltransferase [Quadrisphaera granulorum]|uniref:Prepilin leader peptidase/N-methyltransferase n=1 Tax=Quadrisphaera granulorum TaxID=317664 RepID=A0A315ZSY9_9ACTN|nr:A24 family peptidase [Quadrisphaera granulorum]PWJ47998.1 leader peptidase (prepilin peptidase)/N-methyltransferase [Quadrisphaera granulorum]SZE98570.1 leader peptidase (prepilin peptidase) / N-methyltransferase [Quadrisphaera granulorum]